MRIGTGWIVLCLAACSLLLGGCGFHLQGASPLPAGVSSMHVSYHNDYRVGTPPLVAALRQRLRRQHLLGGADAKAQLDIVRLDSREHVVAVSPIDASGAEYELTVRVVFNYRVNGKARLSGQNLSTSRTYSANPGQQLADESERSTLMADMQKDLANEVLERIARFNRQHGDGS